MLARICRPNASWSLSPFNELQRELDRFLGDGWTGRREAVLCCSVDVREDADHVYLDAELPGLTADDIEITLEDGVMHLSGEKKIEREEQGENYHVAERRAGKFSRTFQLPSMVDEDNIVATLKDGVLTVTLNKREEVKPRRIEVKRN